MSKNFGLFWNEYAWVFKCECVSVGLCVCVCVCVCDFKIKNSAGATLMLDQID